MFNTGATRISSFDYKTKEKFERTVRSTTQFHFAFIKNIQLNKEAIKGGFGGETIVSPKKTKAKIERVISSTTPISFFFH
jgi:hypothetical protein